MVVVLVQACRWCWAVLIVCGWCCWVLDIGHHCLLLSITVHRLLVSLSSSGVVSFRMVMWPLTCQRAFPLGRGNEVGS